MRCSWRGLLVFASSVMFVGCSSVQQISDDEAVFSKIVEAHRKYGSSPKDWPAHEFRTHQIQPVVVLAPQFSPDILAPYVRKISQVAHGRFPVFDVETRQGQHISFVRVGVGACNTLDAVLALADTPCHTVLFLGSVGSLTEKAAIGDIVIPMESRNGCGADLYLTTDSFLKNSLGKIYQADPASQAKLAGIAKLEAGSRVAVHDLKVISVDTVVGEYHHLNEIKNLGCEAIEMETATFFHAARIAGKKATALLYVVDCTFQGQSLYYGRTSDLKAKKENVKKTIIPNIILKFAQS